MLKKDVYIKLYEDIMKDTESLKIEYTISDKYVKNLKPLFGIKEVIANFYDANDINFEMSYKDKSLIIKDTNIGIDIKYMIIGNSGSRESDSKIGEHGEGYKIGALTIVREGGRFLISTVGYSIAFGIEFSEILNTNVMFAKYRKNTKIAGTEVYIECKENDYNNAKKMFLFLNNYERISDNIIVFEDSKLKPIYLNGLEHTQKKSIFSYNFNEKNQISNRDRNFINQDVLESSLISIYQKIDNQTIIEKIIDYFLKYKDSFDSLLEGRVINKVELSINQKNLYKQALNPTHYFTTSQNAELDEETLDSNEIQVIIKVDFNLFYFLEYIGANVLYFEDNIQNENKKDTENSYSFLIEEVDNLNFTSIEISVSNFLSNNSYLNEVNNQSSIYKLNLNNSKFKQQDYFFEYFQNLKLNNASSFTQTMDNDFSIFISNLIRLKCMKNMKISIIFGNESSITFESNISNGKFYVIIKKDLFLQSTSFQLAPHQLAIIIDYPFALQNSYAKLEENYFYFNNLKLKAIKSIYSYKVNINSNLDMQVNNIICKEILSKKESTIEFFNNLLDTANIGLYEHSIQIYKKTYFDILGKKNTKLFIDLFNKKFSNHCLKFTEKYDVIVEEKYGYKIFKSVSDQFTSFLKNIGILNSFEVFKKEQETLILTIPNNEIMQTAILLFEEVYEIQKNEISILTAFSLPNDKESFNENNIIYINNNVSNIPEYLASLMGYEYMQCKYKVSSPTHELQNYLTHHKLD